MSVRALSWVFDHSPVEHRGDLLVLLVLADHAGSGGESAYPSVATIARKARLSERGAQIALRRLEALGAIKATGRGPKGTIAYKVITEAQPLRGEVTAGGCTLLPVGVQSEAEIVSLTAPEPSVNRQEPSNPPNPPRGGLSIPVKPVGNRKTDLERFDAQLRAYAREHFPDLDELHAAQLVRSSLGNGGFGAPNRLGDPTHEGIAAWVRRWTTGEQEAIA